MKIVNDEYKVIAESLDGDARYIERITLDDGTVLTDKIEELKYSNMCNNSTNFSFGNTASAILEFQIDMPTVELQDKEIVVEQGLELADGTIEYIKLGKFKVDSAETEAFRTSYRCVDAMTYKMSTKYESQLTYPATDLDVLEEVCAQAGISLVNSDLTSHTVSKKLENYTKREIIGIIAQLQGKNAIINTDGNLELLWYENADYVIDDSRIYSDRTDIIKSEINYSLGYIASTYGSTSIRVGDGETGATISNPYMTQDILDEVFAKIGGFTFTTAEVDFYGDFRLEVGDIVSLQTDGITYVLPVMTLEHNSDGGVVTTVGSVGETATQNSVDTNGKTLNELKRSVVNSETARSIAEQSADKINFIVEGDSVSEFTISDNALNIISENIDLTGKITFNSFDKETQETLSNANDAIDKANEAMTQVNKTVKSIIMHYLATTLASGVTTSTSGWTTTVQQINATKKYLWTYQTINYVDNTTTDTSPVISGVYGNEGTNGVGITSVTPLYYLKSNATAPSAPTSAVTSTSTGSGVWTTAIPKYVSGYTYFTCTQTQYTNGTYKWSTVVADTALTDVNASVIGDNLIPYPYFHTTQTQSGMTFTDMRDGTTKISGTSTASCFFVLRSGVETDTALWLKKGTYTLSGGSNNAILQLFRVEDTTSKYKLAESKGSSATFALTEDTKIQVQLYVPSGVNGNNEIVKPMLEKGSVAHAYQPYVMSRQGLVEQILAENLLIYPYNQSYGTRNGITWTDSGDGTVKANGTNSSTGQNIHSCRVRSGGSEPNPLVLPKGTYTVSGCPSGGSSSTYYIQVGRTLNGAFNGLGNDYGSGITFTLTENTQIQVQLVVAGSATVNNIIFKPMLEVGTVAHPYREYSKGGEGITNNIYQAGTTLIDGGKIYTGSITANKIDVDDLFAQTITATGTITGAKLFGTYAEIDGGKVGEFALDEGTLVGIRQNGKQIILSSNAMSWLNGGTPCLTFSIDGLTLEQIENIKKYNIFDFLPSPTLHLNAITTDTIITGDPLYVAKPIMLKISADKIEALNGDGTTISTLLSTDSTGKTIIPNLEVTGNTTLNNEVFVSAPSWNPLEIKRTGSSGNVAIKFEDDRGILGYLIINAPDGKLRRMLGSDTNKVYDLMDSSGGTFSGNVGIGSASEALWTRLLIQNSLRQLQFAINTSGQGGIYDGTNSKWLLISDADGSVTLPDLKKDTDTHVVCASSTGKLVVSTVTSGALYYIRNLTGDAQEQLDNRLTLSGGGKVNAPVSTQTLTPTTDSTSTSTGHTIGTSKYKWRYLYAFSSSIQTSDRNYKHRFDYEDVQRLDSFFDALKPCSYFMIGGDRKHLGFVAQDVEEAMNQNGMTIDDLSFVCKDAEYTLKDEEQPDTEENREYTLDEKGNQKYIYGLKYTELHALEVEQIQRLKIRVSDLEFALSQAIARIEMLEEKLNQ